MTVATHLATRDIKASLPWASVPPNSGPTTRSSGAKPPLPAKVLISEELPRDDPSEYVWEFRTAPWNRPLTIAHALVLRAEPDGDPYIFLVESWAPAGLIPPDVLVSAKDEDELLESVRTHSFREDQPYRACEYVQVADLSDSERRILKIGRKTAAVQRRVDYFTEDGEIFLIRRLLLPWGVSLVVTDRNLEWESTLGIRHAIW